MTPDWIPNIHPLFVHFPIALLVTAVLFDTARLFFRDEKWLEKTTLALFATGTLGLIASFLSGQHAVDTVTVSGNAVSIVTSHEDWALYTTIFFLVFTGIRFVTSWKDLEKSWVHPLLILFAFIGTGMLWYTGELGTRLVYEHGVAVGETDRLQLRIEDLERDLSAFREESGPEIDENGSWIWRIGPGAGQILSDSFTVEGSTGFNVETDRSEGIYHLTLVAADESSWFLIGDVIRSVDGRIELKTEEFSGEFALIHHYQNRENYQYLKLSGSELSQGQIRNGSDNVLDSGQIEPGGWITLRVTADSGHFYGYVNRQTIVHTHSDEMAPGRTGIYIHGEGTVLIRIMGFNSIE